MNQKLKTNKSASKRFKRIAKTNNFKHRHANKSHLNTKMSSKKKRQMKSMILVKSCNIKNLRKQLPY